MKNFSNILNVVLFLAVAVLYYLHFTKCSGCSKSSPQTQLAIQKMSGGAKVVFINSDSLMEQYSKFKDMSNELEQQEKALSDKIRAKEEGLQRDYVELMQKAQAGKITEFTAKTQQEDLMKRNDALQKEKQIEGDALMRKAKTQNDALINEVSKFFKENKAAYGNYDMVVGYQKNGAFLYVNDSLDITKSVISDLNAKVK